jgi:hypothetical protein
LRSQRSQKSQRNAPRRGFALSEDLHESLFNFAVSSINDLKKLAPLLCQDNRPTHAIKQRRPERAFKASYGPADSRLT